MSTIAVRGGLRSLGASGLRCFPLAYGCWRLRRGDGPSAQEKIETALDAGMNLIDTADCYGADGFGQTESLLGDVLSGSPGLRERLVIATKGGVVPGVPYDSSPDYLRTAVEASLRRLRIDVIDLYQIHRPDYLGHPAHIAEVLSELRETGKIREAGVSNYTPSQVRALQAHLSFPLVTHQPQFSCWHYAPLDDGVLDLCLEQNLTPLAWSPLAMGKLGLSVDATRQEPAGERLATLLTKLDELAAARETTRTAVALAWLMLHPAGVIPIVGTQQLTRIRDSVRALDVAMTRTEWNAILVAARGERLP